MPAPATPIATPSRPPLASCVIIARCACHCFAAGSIAGLRSRNASAARPICAAGKAPDKSSEAVLARWISSRSWSICSAVVTLQRFLPRKGAPLPHSSATCWPSCSYAPLAEAFDHGVDVVARPLADAGDNQCPCRDLAQFLAVQYGTTAEFALRAMAKPRDRRPRGAVRQPVRHDLIRPQHAAMAVGGRRGLLAPYREIAFLFDALRGFCFCLPGFRRAGLQQRNLLLRRNGIPIDTLTQREVARRLLASIVSLAEQLAHRVRDIGEPRGTGALVEHGLDAELAGPGRDIGMVDGTQLLDPPGQPVEIDGADMPAVGQDAIEHGYMGMQLRIRRLQRHLADVGVGPALPVPPLDIDGRPRGVVLEADPPELAGLDTIPPPWPRCGKAELRLGIGHRVGDGMAVNIEEGGAFCLGRRQGPGDRQRLVGRKRHVDKPDRRARRVDLPAVIRHIDQPPSRQAAVLQLLEFVGGCFAMRRHTQRRLEPLARTFDDLGRQGLADGSSEACRRRRACRRARSGSLPPMAAASDQDRTPRRRCGSRYAFYAQ